MSLEVVRLTPDDYENEVDFINLVFSQNSVPHNFERLMPRWVRPEEVGRNVAVKRDGRIRACIMGAPMNVHVAGRRLLVYGIGNVSTHLSERGTGLMRMAMTRTLEDMQKDGADLAALGGMRQRYGFYGFETCGSHIACTLTSHNVRHSAIEAPDVHFEPLSGWDDPVMADIRRLYESQPLYTERGDDREFYLTLTMWNNLPFVIRRADGSFAGYLCTDARFGGIVEIGLEDEAWTLGVLKAWMALRHVDSVRFSVYEWQHELLRAASAVCSSFDSGIDHMYRVFHWDRVTDALLALRASCTPLPSGEVVLKIGEWGNLLMHVGADGSTECSRTDRAPDAGLSEFEAMRALFGPLAPGAAAAFPARTEMLLRAWCPLPLSWHGLDNV